MLRQQPGRRKEEAWDGSSSVVQERLGHSTISVTLDVYSHVMPDMQRQAADRLETLLTGP